MTRTNSKRIEGIAVLFLICLLFPANKLAPAVEKERMNDKTSDRGKAAARSFRFNYGARISGQEPGAKIKVWFPVPSTTPFQKIDLVSVQVPGIFHVNTEHRYGNRIGYFESQIAGDGTLSFSVSYRIRRREAHADGSTLDRGTSKTYLQQNRLVPISGKPIELVDKKTLDANPMQLARQLYEIVGQHMTYDKSKPGYGNGDVLWACDSKTGNCTDFHSLFISLARSQGLPAKFEIGFPLPNDESEGIVNGYHCWAWFFEPNSGWVPVDISEADKKPDWKTYYFGRLQPDRVAFSTGRDIELYPPSASPPLNYFIYPLIQVSGKIVDGSQIRHDFSFAEMVSEVTEKTKGTP